jgi:DNA recombination protein Rad52
MKIEELDKPLDRAVVKTRSKGNFDLSYIEGWWAISEANRIFGFDGWARETLYCKEVCRYTTGNNKEKVGYEAMVKISVFNYEDGTEITRIGTGHGSGIANDLFDAIEGAAKEAETDAMKRALMTFGNPFGLALYDKTQKNVQIAPEPVDPKRVAKAIEFFREIIDIDIIEENFEKVQAAWNRLTNDERMAVMGGLKPLKAGASGKKKYSTILGEYLDYVHIDDPDKVFNG